MDSRFLMMRTFCTLFFVVFVGVASAEMITAGAAGIVALGSLIGAGVEAWINWRGLQKQVEENRRAEKLQLRLRGEDIKRQDRYRREDIARENKAAEKSEEWKKRGFRNQVEMQNFNKITSIVGGFSNKLNQSPGLANNLINTWRSRRAA